MNQEEYVNKEVQGLKQQKISKEDEARALQNDINSLNLQISQKKVQVKNFKKYYPDNAVAITSAAQKLEFMDRQVSAKEAVYQGVKSEINVLDGRISDAENKEKEGQNKLQQQSVDAEKKQMKMAEGEKKASQHLSKFGGHASGFFSRLSSMGLLFVIFFIFAAALDFGLLNDYFSSLDNSVGTLLTPFGPVCIIHLFQFFLVIWFFIDSGYNEEYILILMLALVVDFLYLSLVPVMIILSYLKLCTGERIKLKSLVLLGVLCLVGLAAIVGIPFITTTLPEMLGVSPIMVPSSSTEPDDDSGAGSTSSSDGWFSDFICFLNPLGCEQKTDADADDDSGGMVDIRELKLSLAPSDRESVSEIPGDYFKFEWKIENNGDLPIKSALFLMNGTQIHGVEGGLIDIEYNYNAFSGKKGYPGVKIPDKFFYAEYPPVFGGRSKIVDVYGFAPGCSLGFFETPVFVMYNYSLDASIMLTFADNDWWETLDDQGRSVELRPRESVSTIGPFSLSIYPDDSQPVLISEGEVFGINFDLSNNDKGRAAINKFEIYISDKLDMIGLDSDRCHFKSLASPSISSSSMAAYELRKELFDDINSVDLSVYDDGFGGGLKEYECSFKYKLEDYDDDFRAGSVQRYIRAYVEYTYVYNGIFTLTTINETGFDVCGADEEEDVVEVIDEE
ncbi:MAG: hypothetical protein U9P44_01865 [archaeon]|nr:hypothetical protein [archaeon]